MTLQPCQRSKTQSKSWLRDRSRKGQIDKDRPLLTSKTFIV